MRDDGSHLLTAVQQEEMLARFGQPYVRVATEVAGLASRKDRRAFTRAQKRSRKRRAR